MTWVIKNLKKCVYFINLLIIVLGPNNSSLSTMDDSTCDILGLFNKSIFYFSPTAASSRDTALDLSQKNKINARLTAAVNKCSPIQVPTSKI